MAIKNHITLTGNYAQVPTTLWISWLYKRVKYVDKLLCVTVYRLSGHNLRESFYHISEYKIFKYSIHGPQIECCGTFLSFVCVQCATQTVKREIQAIYLLLPIYKTYCIWEESEETFAAFCAASQFSATSRGEVNPTRLCGVILSVNWIFKNKKI